MAAAQGFVDPSRAVLRVEGPEARDWLQGLVTNNVDRLAPERPVYAALLNPQGKYLFDFLLLDGGPGTVRLDVAADRAAALLQRLSLYRLRRKVALAEEPALQVAVGWGERPPGALPDPRHPELGWRLYAEDAAAALSAAGVAPAARDDYDRRRIALAVPESGVELVPEDSYVLEAGLDRLNGVDFRKGCYVGQEVTARMRHKTALRKGLARVAVDGVPPPPGSPVATAEGRPAGILFSVAGGEGLAHLRFDRAEGDMRAGEATLRRVAE